MSTPTPMTDTDAVELLRAIVAYFEAYPDEKPTTMTAYDLAVDLIESLPHATLDTNGLTQDRLVAAGLA